MLIEILLDGQVVSTRDVSEPTGSDADPRLLKRFALEMALAANEVKLSDALRVTFRTRK